MSSELPELISTGKLADFLGVTPRWLQQLSKDGKLPRVIGEDGKEAFGKFPFKTAVQAYIQSLKESTTETDDEKELNELKKHILRNKAEQGDIDLSERKNEVHAADAVRQIFGGMVVTIRSRLQALPHLVAPNLQSKESIPEIVEIVTKGVKQVLLELKDYDPREFAQQAKLTYKEVDPEKVQADIDAAEEFNRNYAE